MQCLYKHSELDIIQFIRVINTDWAVGLIELTKSFDSIYFYIVYSYRVIDTILVTLEP